jgi:hypothetical protein
MQFEHGPCGRELIGLIGYEVNDRTRKELAEELECLLKQQRPTLEARLLEIPHRGGYFFREK